MVSIFVPLTPEDAALDATLALTTGGAGNVARRVGKAGEAIATTFKLNKAYSAIKGTKAAQQAAKVADLVWSARLRDYPNLANNPGLVTAIRNKKLTQTELQKLDADLGANPPLVQTLGNPDALGQWQQLSRTTASANLKRNERLIESFSKRQCN